jgi:hypothetical protein
LYQNIKQSKEAFHEKIEESSNEVVGNSAKQELSVLPHLTDFFTFFFNLFTDYIDPLKLIVAIQQLVYSPQTVMKERGELD